MRSGPSSAESLEEWCADDPELRAKVEWLLVQDTEAERDGFLTTPASTGREALRFDGSTDGEFEFNHEHRWKATSDETPSTAATPPPGLAEHPDYEIKRSSAGAEWALFTSPRIGSWDGTRYSRFLGVRSWNALVVWNVFSARSVPSQHSAIPISSRRTPRLGSAKARCWQWSTLTAPTWPRSSGREGRSPWRMPAITCARRCLACSTPHEHGMVHRDLKPSNLMLIREGDRDVIKVLDFGLAKVNTERRTDGTLTYEGQMLGTPDFIAPEQIRDSQSADIRADIYSLGCTLYFLLAGGPPFARSCIYDTLQAHHSADATPLSQVRPRCAR